MFAAHDRDLTWRGRDGVAIGSIGSLRNHYRRSRLYINKNVNGSKTFSGQPQEVLSPIGLMSFAIAF